MRIQVSKYFFYLKNKYKGKIKYPKMGITNAFKNKDSFLC